MSDTNDKIRIVQETVAGKEITFAHVIGGPAPIIYQKLGLNPGLSAVHRAHFAAGIRQELGRPVVVVCADEGEAERMARDLAALSGEAVRTLSARGDPALRSSRCTVLHDIVNAVRVGLLFRCGFRSGKMPDVLPDLLEI